MQPLIEYITGELFTLPKCLLTQYLITTTTSLLQAPKSQKATQTLTIWTTSHTHPGKTARLDTRMNYTGRKTTPRWTWNSCCQAQESASKRKYLNYNRKYLDCLQKTITITLI